jgi:hypothetical protein
VVPMVQFVVPMVQFVVPMVQFVVPMVQSVVPMVQFVILHLCLCIFALLDSFFNFFWVDFVVLGGVHVLLLMIWFTSLTEILLR